MEVEAKTQPTNVEKHVRKGTRVPFVLFFYEPIVCNGLFRSNLYKLDLDVTSQFFGEYQ